MDIFEKLNDKQVEAVKETEGYVRVIAGAGSGKTKLLVSRYAYLVKEYGIDSANILCVTFTNKAAAEMQSRIRALIGDGYDTSLICTYHGFCARLIKENAEKLFLPTNFQIIDTYQQKQILEDIYQKYDLKLDHATFESYLKKIGEIKKDAAYVQKLCSPEKQQILIDTKDLDGMVIEEYLQRQKATYSLDFDDLLNFAMYLLETDTEVREKWQSRLNYIQVDEFQDSSKREMKLVGILSAKFGNLFIVGDPDQNIYEWRGSDVALLVDFDKAHQDTKTVILNQNYRSTPEILTCANTLIDKNTYRMKRDLFTEAPGGQSVIHYHSKSEEEETGIIAGTIRNLKNKEGLSYSDMAILYRTNFLSRVIEKRLVEENIPYEIYGGVKFYQRMEVQDVIAYLRVIAYKDDVSLKRIINKPRRKFGRSKMQALISLNEKQSKEEGKKRSLYTTLKMHIGEDSFKGSGAEDFVSFIESLRTAKKKLPISDIVQRVTEDSGYEQYIRSLGDEERLENLAEFKRIASEFERSFGEDLSLQEFLQQISLQSSEDEDKQKDCVKLMTIHTAKGLEFPVVFLVGLTEGIFPSSRTIEERKRLGLEEERRLCYVGITRAKERLFLMDSEGFSPNNLSKYPSRFLFEIGEKNYERRGVISKDAMYGSRQLIKKLNGQLDNTEVLAVGSTVFHHVFGRGEILSVNNKRHSYQISFPEKGFVRDISFGYFEPKEEQMDAEESFVEPAEENTEPKTKAYKQPQGKPMQVTFVFPLAPESIQKEDVENGTQTAEAPKPRKLTEAQEAALKEKLQKTDNLWKRDDVPHDGWRCIGITDLEAPVGVCEMCGHQIIRYVHHMVHNDYPVSLGVGCICAGKMEGNPEAAKKRESEFKNRQSRIENFKKKEWKQSFKGNDYIKYHGHLIVLYFTGNNKWKYSIDGVFSPHEYQKKKQAIDAIAQKLADGLLEKQ